MPEAPRDIRLFETVQLVLMFSALVSSFVLDQALIRAFGIGAIIGKTLAIGGFIGLTLLVTRGRKNWARWVLLAVYLVGALVEAWNFRAIAEFGHPVIVITSVVLRGAALVLAFTPQSTEWLRTEPQAA